ncbi:hypothetical protein GQ44DRAFT_769506 [Phaeosphaeriaceae sp. PMI808]|nr:hypothetical protein GQ44DRAFT_769506 [Phaeosphaeriaceae sp. PMI808]
MPTLSPSPSAPIGPPTRSSALRPNLKSLAVPAFQSLDEGVSVPNIAAYGASYNFSCEPHISLGSLYSADVPIAFRQTTGYPNAIQNVSGMTVLGALGFTSIDLTLDAPSTHFSSVNSTTLTDQGDCNSMRTYQYAVNVPNTKYPGYSTNNQALLLANSMENIHLTPFYYGHLCNHGNIAFEYELESLLDSQEIDRALILHQQMTNLCPDSSPGMRIYHNETNAIDVLQNLSYFPQYPEIGYLGETQARDGPLAPTAIGMGHVQHQPGGGVLDGGIYAAPYLQTTLWS